jgi:hypothetical protein
MPVVGDDGRLLGIVARRDLLRLHIRPDDEIRADVTDNVLRRTLWIEPGVVAVDVDRGTVTLRGQPGSRVLAGRRQRAERGCGHRPSGLTRPSDAPRNEASGYAGRRPARR